MLIDTPKLISTYKKNQHLISKLRNTQHKINEDVKKKRNKIYHEYDDKITALEKQRDKVYDSLDKELEKIDHKTEKKISTLYTPINDVKRIIYFLNQKELQLDFDASKTTNRYGYLELLGKYTDEHLKLACYVAENDRPKNKYSLVIVGMCRFGDHSESKILKLPYDYGCNLSHSEIQWFDIAKIIKHFSSIESTKKYFESHNIVQMLNSFLAEYHTVLEQYQEAISVYKISDFAEILKGENL